MSCSLDNLTSPTDLASALEVIAVLLKEVRELRAENAALKEENRLLREENAELRKENALLRSENEGLKRKVASLSKSSRTSSKPPSSDIVNPKKSKGKKGKKRTKGGQPGHKGVEHKLVPRNMVDRFVPLVPTTCPDCRGALDRCFDKEPLIKQVLELVEKPVETIQYERYAGCCQKCRKVSYADLPDGVHPFTRLGPRLEASFAFMRGATCASQSEICEVGREVLGVELDKGSLCNIEKRVSAALEEPYEELEEAIAEEPSLNVDETGWKEAGKKMWAWAFCTSLIAFFCIRESRGSKVLFEILGTTFQGALTSDFFSAYTKFASPKQQFCLAHLIRDIRYLTTLPSKPTQRFGLELLVFFRSVFKLWNKRGEFGQEELQRRMRYITEKLKKYLERKRPSEREARNIQKRILKHWDSLFRFIEEPHLYSPTNNHSERMLRRLVRLRRTTQGSRTIHGRDWVSRIVTTVETCKLQKRSSFEFIYDSLKAHYFGGPFPSLVPSVH